MKKHLQFNDITALSLGWRAARRKAERERRVEREKEQSSSSLLCIFIRGKYYFFPPTPTPLFSFFFLVFWLFLSHSFTFFFFSASLSSVPFRLLLILPPTHFFFLSLSPLCVLIHLWGPFSFTLEEAVYPTMYPFSCVVLLVL